MLLLSDPGHNAFPAVLSLAKFAYEVAKAWGLWLKKGSLLSPECSLLRSRYQGRHATLWWGEALCDDPNNGCEGDYR